MSTGIEAHRRTAAPGGSPRAAQARRDSGDGANRTPAAHGAAERARSLLLRGGRLTKLAGEVASFAPALGRLCASPLRSAGALGLAAAAFAFAGSSQPAWPNTFLPPGFTLPFCGPVNGSASEFYCKGSVAGFTKTYDGSAALTLTTRYKFSGRTRHNPTVNLTQSGTGGIVIKQQSGGTFTSETRDGIRAHSASGPITITLTGTVTAARRGVYARSVSGSGAVAVSVASVTAQHDGVQVLSSSTGAMSVNVGNVTGGFRGVSATSLDSGTVTVTASGPVTGTQKEGIFASARGGALKVTAQGGVHGGRFGIYARNSGGPINVKATDMVTVGTAASESVPSAGIYAKMDGSQSSITVRAAGISNQRGDGVRVRHSGSGTVSVVGTGRVNAFGDGISLFGSSAVALNTKTGVIEAQGHGVHAEVHAATGAIHLSTGEVIAKRDAVVAVSSSTVNRVTAVSSGRITSRSGSGIRVDTSGGAQLSASEAVKGRMRGVSVTSSGPKAIVVSVASATGELQEGIHAVARDAGVDVTASGLVHGGRSGIVARSGRGPVRVTTRGLVTTGSEAVDPQNRHAGIYAKGEGGGSSVAVIAGSITSALRHGVWAQNLGTGTASVTVAGSVAAAQRDGVHALGGERAGGVLVKVASGATVAGGSRGIFAKSAGSGAVLVDVLGVVTGGSGAGDAAIRTDTPSGVAASILIGGPIRNPGRWTRIGARGANLSASGVKSVGSAGRRAIVDGAGDATVMVEGGGSIIGSVSLGAGSDFLAFAGGFEQAGRLDGGAGEDELHLGGGLSPTPLVVPKANLTGWETISIYRGALLRGETDINSMRNLIFDRANFSDVTRFEGSGTLTFRNYSMSTLPTDQMSGWSAVEVGTGSTLSVNGRQSIAASATGGLKLTGIAYFTDGAVGDVLSVGGNFEGGGGTLRMDLDFASSAADKLEIGGTASGATTVELSMLSQVSAGGEERVVEIVSGSGLKYGMFALSGGPFAVGSKFYGLWPSRDGAAIRLQVVPGCYAATKGSGVFTCDGSSPLAQTLKASGSTTLDVRLRPSASISTKAGAALTLLQNGTAGLTVSQRGSGRISGVDSAISARNLVGGDVSIATAGRVDGSGTGIDVDNAADSGRVLISAAGHVSAGADARFGAEAAGIRVRSNGGMVSIAAATVTGGGRGISVDQHAGSGAGKASLNISAGRLSTSATGIRAISSTTGGIYITALSGIESRAGDGMEVANASSGTSGSQGGFGDASRFISIVSGSVTAHRDGIAARTSGSGGILIVSVGTVTGGRDGISVAAGAGISTRDADVGISVSGDVRGGANGRGSAIRSDTAAGARVSMTIAGAASIGSPESYAIIDGAGDARVTMNYPAKIAGSVTLGGGSDSVFLREGGFGKIERLDGGSGTDVLVLGGAVTELHDSLQSEGFKGWETIRVVSGGLAGAVAVDSALRAMSFEGADFSGVTGFWGGGSGSLAFADVSGTLDATKISDWTELEIGRGAEISFLGGQILPQAAAETVTLSGTLNLADGAADDRLSIGGILEGGGVLALDVDFESGRADTLSLSSATLALKAGLEVRAVNPDSARGASIALVSLASAEGALKPGMLTLREGPVGAGGSRYDLQISANGRSLNLAEIIGCVEEAIDHFICSGAIRGGQRFSSTGSRALRVELWPSAEILSSGTEQAVELRASGSGTVELTQSAGGRQIRGGEEGVYARGAGGAISITTTGTVFGTRSGIRALSDSGGAIAIKAQGGVAAGETVKGSTTSVAGIFAHAHGGDVVVSAGSITSSGAGIWVVQDDASASASATVSVETVTAQWDGINVRSSTTGGVPQIVATGDIESLGGTGIRVVGWNSASNGVAISAEGISAGGDAGIFVADRSASGATSVTVAGDVRARRGAGLEINGAGAGLTVRTLGSVYGYRRGIMAAGRGGDTLVVAQGSVTASGRSGRTEGAISAQNSDRGRNLTVRAASVSHPGRIGIFAKNLGTGATMVTATGSVTASDAAGCLDQGGMTGCIGIYARNTSALSDSLTVAAASVHGGRRGISASNLGSGTLFVKISGSVTGGTGVDDAAIWTQTRSAGAVAISLDSSATVGGQGRAAIVDGSGNAAVAVASGGSVAGRIALGGGSDTLRFAGDSFGGVEDFDGGAGNDTLRFTGGAGAMHASVQSAGFRNWENVVFDGGARPSGAITMHPSSADLTFDGAVIEDVARFAGSGGGIALRNLSGALDTSALSNWSTLEIGSGAVVSVSSGTLASGAAQRLKLTGTMSLANAVAGDRFAVAGPIEGGGTLRLDVDFATAQADMVTVGSVTGSGIAVDVVALGGTPLERDGIEVVSQQVGSDSLDASMFSLPGGGPLAVGGFRYALNVAPGGLSLRLELLAGCFENGTGTDAYVCRGALSAGQSFLASAARDLTVDLLRSATVNVSSGPAFSLRHAGTGAIGLTQSAGGQAIRGVGHGLHAKTEKGGAVSIAVGGVSGGASGDGIRAEVDATEGASATMVSVSAGEVSGGAGGVWVRNKGLGGIRIAASSATGGAGHGVYAHAGRAGATGSGSIAVAIGSGTGAAFLGASVTGGGVGIWAINEGAGSVEIGAGSVVGRRSGGVVVQNAGNSATIAVATALGGGGAGISVSNAGAGAIDVRASGSVTGSGRGNMGVYLHNSNAEAGALSSVTLAVGTLSGTLFTGAAVSGEDDGIRAVSRGGGRLDISAGAVAGGSDGVWAHNPGGGDLSISVSSAAGLWGHGIHARNGRIGNVSIKVAGPVTGWGIAPGGARHHGIFADAAEDASGSIAIIAGTGSGSGFVGASVTGTGEGIRIVSGGRSVSIAAGSISGGNAGVSVESRGAGDLAVSLSAARISGGAHGVRVHGSGTGDVSVALSGTVVGGVAGAAIQTDAAGAVRLSLGADARIGTVGQAAILDGSGTVAVTAHADASITGRIALGGGADTFSVPIGVLAGIERVDGGSGADRLILSGGSGTLNTAALSSWDILEIGSGASVLVNGAQSLPASSAGGLKLGGLLSLADGAADDSFAVSGTFEGGGEIAVDVDFAAGRADTLTASGMASGSPATALRVSGLGAASADGSRIDVVSVSSGRIAQGALALAGGPVDVGLLRYGLEFSADGRSAFLILHPGCYETGTGTDSYVCSRAISEAQILSASGSQALDVDMASSASADTSAGTGSAFSLVHAGSGGIDFAQGAGGLAIRGAAHGIHAANSGAGAVRIVATGPVFGAASGIHVTDDGGGITISSTGVSGAASGIEAIARGTGSVSIEATESVSGTGAKGAGIHVVAGSQTAEISIAAASVTGDLAGIMAMASGTGGVSIFASGTILATTGDGILVERSGDGSTTISVSDSVAGGSGTESAAIRTDAGDGNSVIVSLASGALIGADGRSAVIGSGGDTELTVSAGAAIIGSVTLGAGADELVFDGGAFSSATALDGGAGADTLTFRAGGGSLHPSVQSDGLKGWEVVLVESGATISGDIKLAESSDRLTFEKADIKGIGALTAAGSNGANALAFNNVSGSLAGKTLTGWETVGIGAGSTIKFAEGSHTLQAALSVSAGGTLDIGRDTDTADALTVSGAFAGGGTVALNANFLPGAGASDRLAIAGSVTGTTNLVVTALAGNLGANQTYMDRPLRISGVVKVEGSVAAGAFTSSVVEFFGVGYQLKVDGTGKAFDLVRFFTNACAAVPATPGAFTCSGTGLIGGSQSLSASGATALSVTLNSETPVGADGTAFILAQTGGTGGVSLTQSATGESISGAMSGITARNSGGGAISIDVNGSVTGVAGDGISASSDASGSGITVAAGSVSGADSGIRAVEGGAGAVQIAATGTVTGASEEGIYAKTSDSGGAVTVTAADVTGAKAGIRAVSSGTGAVAVHATGSVTADAAGGVGIDASAKGGDVTIAVASVAGSVTGLKVFATGAGDVSIMASGRVAGAANDGIFVDHDGSGSASITASGAVTGGAGADVAAIRTDVSAGSDVTISLGSGADVGLGAANAIIGGAGDSSVTVNTGAAIAGKVILGAGSDALTFEGGAFSAVTEMDGGTGAADTLVFSGAAGSLHPTVQSDGLKGWESVIVKNGATISGSVTLADDSGNLTFEDSSIASVGVLSGGGGSANALAFNNVSGSLASSSLTGWETIRIGAGSTIGFGDATQTLAVQTLGVTGTLDVGKDTDTTDALTVSGTLVGGGTIALNANFVTRAKDTLTITGSVTGTTNLVVTKIGDPLGNSQRPAKIAGVITVQGSVAAGAFTSTPVDFGEIAYRLQADGTGKVFDLVQFFTNMCAPVSATPGAFTCSGTYRIGASQALSASGATALSVTLNSETPVDTKETAFALTQTGGAGGITFTQSATGKSITGAAGGGIDATNSGGGAISINVSGSVTGADGDGINAVNDASGSGITITAASASGARTGIRAIEAGSGAVKIVATGSVAGAANDGIIAKTATSGGAIAVTAASVTGYRFGIIARSFAGISIVQSGTGAITARDTGISAVNSGGSISINVTGTVSQTSTNHYKNAFYARNRGAATGDVTISAGDIDGEHFGLVVKNDGTGAIDVTVTGKAKNRSGYASAMAAVQLRNTARGTGISLTFNKRPGAADDAVSVHGERMGISVFNQGTGPTSITVAGEIVGLGNDAAVYVKASPSAGDVTVSLRDRVNFGSGVDAKHEGTGNVSVTVGDMRGRERFGRGTRFYGTPGVKVKTGGSISVTTSGHVDSGGNGFNQPSIWNESSAGGIVTVTLNSGTVLDGGLRDDAGSATVTVNTGATVRRTIHLGLGDDRVNLAGGTVLANMNLGGGADTLRVASGTASGSVDLGAGDDRIEVAGGSLSGTLNAGAGADTLVFDGGAFSSVTGMDGGAGVDTLTFRTGSGSLHASTHATGLKGWESVVVESGATIIGSVTLAGDSGNLTLDQTDFSGITALSGGSGTANTLALTKLSGSLAGKILTGWETVAVGAGSEIKFADGAHTLDAGVSVAASGTLDVGKDSDTADALTVSGDFAGSGTVALNANFAAGGSDTLQITGSVTGTTAINLGGLGSLRAGLTDYDRPARIDGVISVGGAVAAGAFTAPDVKFGPVTYRLTFDAANRRFSLVRDFVNACRETAAGSGAFVCSGSDRISSPQALAASGSTPLSVTLNAETPVQTAFGGAFVLTQNGAGGISLTQSATGQAIQGFKGGIHARNTGGGAVSITVNGSVTGLAGDGVHVINDDSGAGITIAAADVVGSQSGIVVVGHGTGTATIDASGAVTGTQGTGIDATSTSGGALAISAATVTGGGIGIRAVGSGTGAVSVKATGKAKATAAGGVGILAVAGGSGDLTVTAADVEGQAAGLKAIASGTGAVSVFASGSVAGVSGDGILVERSGAGSASIALSGSVTGGAAAAAVRTNVGSGNAATVTLNSGASIGSASRTAIAGGAGNTAVTVNSGATVTGKIALGAGDDAVTLNSGASVTGDVESGSGDDEVTVNSGAALAGKVVLGAGADELLFAGGAFSDVTEMDGGTGTDTLTFREGSGSLHASTHSEGLTGWESVIVESGATISGSVTLASDSGNLTFSGADLSNLTALDGGAGSGNTLAIDGVTHSLAAMNLSGWETIRIGAGSSISFGSGAHAVTAGARLDVTGTLNVGKDTDTDDALTVSGDFSGGGIVALDANFAAGGSDTLRITGSVTGTTAVDLGRLGSLQAGETDYDRPTRIDGVISVDGTVAAGAFTARAARFGPVSYRLSFDAANKRFDLVRHFVNGCEESQAGSGVFVCSGSARIGVTQTLDASGATSLRVTLNAETLVDTLSGAAFDLEQAGSAGIAFTQSATGQDIRGAGDGMLVANTGGGAVSITVNGSVTGAAAHAMHVRNDGSGAGIAITAAAVSGAKSGIVVVGSGSGSVLIDASGTVAGTRGAGIEAASTSGGSLSITAASATGGAYGIRAVGSGTGAVSVKATGAVTGTGTAGVRAVGGTGAAGVSVDVATVTGSIGIDAAKSGAGALTITAAAVTGSAYGIRAVGGGAVSVKATGKVTATDTGGVGILAVARGAGDLTLTAADVEGQAAGLKAIASGTGALSVIASGNVAGVSGDGISVERSEAGSASIALSGSVTGGADCGSRQDQRRQRPRRDRHAQQRRVDWKRVENRDRRRRRKHRIDCELWRDGDGKDRARSGRRCGDVEFRRFHDGRHRIGSGRRRGDAELRRLRDGRRRIGSRRRRSDCELRRGVCRQGRPRCRCGRAALRGRRVLRRYGNGWRDWKRHADIPRGLGQPARLHPFGRPDGLGERHR